MLGLSCMRVVHGDLQCLHCLLKLRGLIRVSLTNLPSLHELLDSSDYSIDVFSGRWVCLNDARVPIPDHKDSFVLSIILLSDAPVVDIVERYQVSKFLQLPLCFIFALPQDSQKGFLYRWVRRWFFDLASFFSVPLLLNQTPPSSSSTSRTSSSSSAISPTSSISTPCSTSRTSSS